MEDPQINYVLQRKIWLQMIPDDMCVCHHTGLKQQACVKFRRNLHYS